MVTSIICCEERTLITSVRLCTAPKNDTQQSSGAECSEICDDAPKRTFRDLAPLDRVWPILCRLKCTVLCKTRLGYFRVSRFIWKKHTSLNWYQHTPQASVVRGKSTMLASRRMEARIGGSCQEHLDINCCNMQCREQIVQQAVAGGGKPTGFTKNQLVSWKENSALYYRWQHSHFFE